MHRVTNDVSPSKPNSIPSGSVAPTSDFHEALTTQISELTSLVHSLRDPLPPSSTTTMASKFTQPWLIDSRASSHKSGNSSLFTTLHAMLFSPMGPHGLLLRRVLFMPPHLYLMFLIFLSIYFLLIS